MVDLVIVDAGNGVYVVCSVIVDGVNGVEMLRDCWWYESGGIQSCGVGNRGAPEKGMERPALHSSGCTKEWNLSHPLLVVCWWCATKAQHVM